MPFRRVPGGGSFAERHGGRSLQCGRIPHENLACSLASTETKRQRATALQRTEASRMAASTLPTILAILLLLMASLCQAGDCDPHARAGQPTRVACYAQPSESRHYIPYRVGGGAVVCGQPPFSHEGTWGWDYQGLLPRRIRLGWWHGRCTQGGSGAYHTDGPTCPTCGCK